MKNGKLMTLEQRVQRLETDLRVIKELLQKNMEAKEPWWNAIAGIYQNDPEAQEVMKSVLEMREKERRQARRQRTRAKKQTARVDR